MTRWSAPARRVRWWFAHVPGSVWVFRWLVLSGSVVKDVAATKRAAGRRRRGRSWTVVRRP